MKTKNQRYYGVIRKSDRFKSDVIKFSVVLEANEKPEVVLTALRRLDDDEPLKEYEEFKMNSDDKKIRAVEQALDGDDNKSDFEYAVEEMIAIEVRKSGGYYAVGDEWNMGAGTTREQALEAFAESEVEPYEHVWASWNK